jgi:hypothetical protein
MKETKQFVLSCSETPPPQPTTMQYFRSICKFVDIGVLAQGQLLNIDHDKERIVMVKVS